MPRTGRPVLPESERKIRESIYFAPDIHKWLESRSEVREASISSFVNVVLRERMKKEKANS